MKAEALLQQALDRAGNTHSVKDVREAVEQGQAQLWCGNASVMVTEVYDYPQAKVLNVWLAAGALNEIITAGGQLDAFARHVGAGSIHLTGRRGWQKVLAPYGYQLRGVQLMRAL